MIAARPRRVLIPQDLSAAALRGLGSALSSVQLQGTTMGTFWSARCLLPLPMTAGRVQETLEVVFAKVIAQMSHWDTTSDLCRFNRAPAGTWQALPEEFWRVLLRAVEIAEASQGRFDPTLGEVVELYGFGPPAKAVTSMADPGLRWAAERCGWRKLGMDASRRAIQQPGGLRLDLSGIAKGFAVDLAAQALEALGVSSYLVEVGGEARGAGCKANGEPWWCLLENPPGEDSAVLPETVVALCGLSVATSGDSLRQRWVGDLCISHLVDPASCRPAQSELTSVSVFAQDCMDADAWATALFVAGLDAGREIAEVRGLPVRWVSRAGDGRLEEHLSSALAAMLE